MWPRAGPGSWGIEIYKILRGRQTWACIDWYNGIGNAPSNVANLPVIRGNALAMAVIFCFTTETATDAAPVFSGERRLNNLVSELLEVTSTSKASDEFVFTQPTSGWLFISSTGKGTARIFLDQEANPLLVHGADGVPTREAMRHAAKGRHTIRMAGEGDFKVERLVVKAIPELIHCGLGFNSEIKSYSVYDLNFLRTDILPNVTTLIVPNNIKLSEATIEDWHRQEKRFVAEVGINGQAKTADEHFDYWRSFYEKAPFLDGIIVNEFIVNRPVVEWAALTAERLARMEKERQQYAQYAEAIKKLQADERFRNKMFYGYVGGSGKKLNQEIVGTNFIRTILDCGYRIALERYLHEMSSEKGSREALQLFVDGISDWETKEPGVTKQLVIAFGLFSMPPGSINKQPNVDYHVWMDQQMNLVANHPTLSGLAGLEWWTSTLADEETVRFVGKLYRHYAIEGRTNLMTTTPLFLTHIQNADFEKGTEGWTVRPAEEGSIAVKTFPRYGRIEGRYMGLGRPADPEHIGDTFLWMRRSEKAPNSFSQRIRNLKPGRLYSMKMLSCDCNDLINPKARKVEDAKPIVHVMIEGVEVDARKSFRETYSSSPEPPIPVCITYHWKVFRAKTETALLTVTDWEDGKGSGYGQEQAFNFVEIQPYWE
jgi:hypothetical protein